MKKRVVLLSLVALLSAFVPTFLIFPSHTHIVNAETQSIKVLTHSLMALGSSLTEEQKIVTKTLLGDSQMSEEQIISVTEQTLAKYVDNTGTVANIYSSVLIKPLEKGSGVQVEIVTPKNITTISSSTYQNAAITSGISDILIRIASVEPVTGEGALAGVYALLEQVGIEVDKTTIQISQDEILLIEKIKAETSLSDDDANKLIAELKKHVTSNVIEKQTVSEDWLKEHVSNVCATYNVTLSEGLQVEIIAWLTSYSTTDVAQSNEAVNQLEQSILAVDWLDVLTNLDTILNANEILALEKMDYSDTTIYHAIIDAVYQRLLSDIREDYLAGVKLIYSQSFVIEHMLATPSLKEKEALNYIRTLCYYFIASKEDGMLATALTEENKPAWLIADTTKANFLNALSRYNTISQNPYLQEIVNRIGIATGYSYEAFLYDNIQQEGDLISLTIVCPCMNQEIKMNASFNLQTGGCTLTIGDETSEIKVYDFEKQYTVNLEDRYQKLIDHLETYQLSQQDMGIFNTRNPQNPDHQPYKEVLEQFYNYSMSADVIPDRFPYLPLLDSASYPPGNRQFKYAIYDLNGDGIDELIISDSNDNHLALYTYNTEVILLKEVSGYRHHMRISQDGTIATYGSGGAYVSGATIDTIATEGQGVIKLHVVTKEFDQSFSQATFIVGEYGTSTETYVGQEEYLKHYGQYEPYLSLEFYRFIESSNQAPVLDPTLFRDITDEIVSSSTSHQQIWPVSKQNELAQYMVNFGHEMNYNFELKS